MCFWINAEDDFKVSIVTILCNNKDFFFFKYKVNMHVGFALSIFAKGAFGKNTKNIILFIPDLAC